MLFYSDASGSVRNVCTFVGYIVCFTIGFSKAEERKPELVACVTV